MRLRDFLLLEKLQIHDELNPKIWKNENLIIDVKKALNNIANEFILFLKIKESLVKDILLVGSNANYNWNPGHSDLDIHVQIDTEGFDKEIIEEYLLTKKSLWNLQHNITVNSVPVELYAEPTSDKEVTSQGVYSLKKDMWIIKPSKIHNLEIDQASIDNKVKSIKKQINDIVYHKCDDIQIIKKLKENIRKLRQTGISKGGEFSTNNLAFKELRDDGYLEKLSNYEEKLQDFKLSLGE